MKIALDISPVLSQHQARGIGSYTKSLREEFKTIQDKNISFIFFENPKNPPQADIIHHPYFDLFFRTLSPDKKAKTVVTVHDVIPLVFPNYFPAGPKGYINLFFQKRALKKTDAIICDSKTSKKDIVDKLSVPESKIHVVYLAPDSNFKKLSTIGANVEKKYHLPKDFILYVGDVNWNKNIGRILEAVKISKKKIVMVGKALCDNSIPETQSINRKISKLGIQKQIIKTGYVTGPDLNQIYNLAKLTLLPSYYEGFGLPVLESMACGTPVICTNVASLSEIAGSDAIFCDPSDSNDIAQKIDSVYGFSKSKLEQLSNKLILHSSSYSWAKTAKDTIGVYRSLV